MHATRGGWLGQTFALAKFDDSFEGKKSRIWRSKEERKGMVETFIRRYQKLNNGDFPSLNLTRKEVGGSFYTVREIVREIIQENRVLGPPKSPPGDQNIENLDSFLEQYPLGSMSVDLHVHVVPPKDAQTLLEHEFGSENFLNTRSITELHQGKLDSDNIVDGSMNKTELLMERGDEEHKGDEEIIYVETSQISGSDVEATHAAMKNDNDEVPMHIESLERGGNKEQKNEGTELEPRVSWRSEVVEVETTHVTVSNEALGKTKNTELLMEGGMVEPVDEVNKLVENQSQKHQLLEDLAAGTSRLEPITSSVHNLDDKSSEREVLDGVEKDTQNGKLATGKNERLVCNEMHLFNKSTDVVDMKSEEEITHLLPESKPTLASQKAQNHQSTKENIVVHVNDTADVKLEDTLPAEDKTINGANAQNLHSETSCISVQQSPLDERSATLNKSSDQPGGNPQKRTNATLNRINLSESWEAASKKSNGRETHRIVTFIKAFITAFVKFWS